MAEIRISGRDLRKIEQLQQRMQGAVKNLDARSVERLTTDVVSRVNSGVKGLLANIERLESRLGVKDEDSKRKLRVGLEGVEGATGAVSGIAPFAALVSASPQGRLALLAGAALFGGLEGLGRDARRRAAESAAQADADFTFSVRERLIAIEADLERRKAALHRARGVR